MKKELEKPWVVFYRVRNKGRNLMIEVKYDGRFYKGEVERDDDYVGKI